MMTKGRNSLRTGEGFAARRPSYQRGRAASWRLVLVILAAIHVLMPPWQALAATGKQAKPAGPSPTQPAPGNASGGKPAGCSVQCITKSWLTPVARSANLNLEVKTHTPARLSAYVSQHAPSHTGEGHPYFPVARPKASTGQSLKSQWKTSLQGLKAETKYHIIVKAVDANGGASYQEGVFKTQKPAVDQGMGMADKGGPSGCATECIEKGKVRPGDKWAELEVETSIPAQMRVKVSTKPPKQGSNGPLFLEFDAWADSGYQLRKTWKATLEPLEPDTLYHIGLWAVDEKGRTSYEQGTFRTRKHVPNTHIHENRAVRITFYNIHVRDNAEKVGKGELSFDFFIQGERRANLHQETRKIKDGQTVKVFWDGTTRPVMHAMLDPSPDVLDLRVFGKEHDPGTFKGGCPVEAFSNPFPSGSGSETCFQWNNAEASIDVHNLPPSEPLCPKIGDQVEDACFRLVAGRNIPTFNVLVSLKFMDFPE